ncbi:MAG: BA14K family protein [Aquamicrobium sp.]|nr:BA14K family protein [Aquamicrobium sp.]
MKHKVAAFAFAAAVCLGLGSGAMASPAAALNTAPAIGDSAQKPTIQLVQGENERWMQNRRNWRDNDRRGGDWRDRRDWRERRHRDWRDDDRWRYRRHYRPRPTIEFHVAPAPRYRPRPGYRLSAAHYRWCEARWRSYRAYDNSYQPYNGPRRECVSPYY